MLDFRGTSIRRKLTRAMMLTSSVALLVASTFFAVYDAMTIRTRIERDLSRLALSLANVARMALHEGKTAKAGAMYAEAAEIATALEDKSGGARRSRTSISSSRPMHRLKSQRCSSSIRWQNPSLRTGRRSRASGCDRESSATSGSSPRPNIRSH